MKRIFKRWLKEVRPKIRKMDSSRITSAFNKWVGGYENKTTKERRFPFNAHTNRFMVRKWLLKMGLYIVELYD